MAELAKVRAQLADVEADTALKEAVLRFLMSGGRTCGDAVGDLRETLQSPSKTHVPFVLGAL